MTVGEQILDLGPYPGIGTVLRQERLTIVLGDIESGVQKLLTCFQDRKRTVTSEPRRVEGVPSSALRLHRTTCGTKRFDRLRRPSRNGL